MQRVLLAKAAECERRMNLSTDPAERFNLKIMHELWTGLLNECASMSPRHLTNEIPAIDEIQSALDGATPQT